MSHGTTELCPIGQRQSSRCSNCTLWCIADTIMGPPVPQGKIRSRAKVSALIHNILGVRYLSPEHTTNTHTHAPTHLHIYNNNNNNNQSINQSINNNNNNIEYVSAFFKRLLLQSIEYGVYINSLMLVAWIQIPPIGCPLPVVICKPDPTHHSTSSFTSVGICCVISNIRILWGCAHVPYIYGYLVLHGMPFDKVYYIGFLSVLHWHQSSS